MTTSAAPPRPASRNPTWTEEAAARVRGRERVFRGHWRRQLGLRPLRLEPLGRARRTPLFH